MSSGFPIRPIIAFAAKLSSVPCQSPAPRDNVRNLSHFQD
jgi:hypothetical protein